MNERDTIDHTLREAKTVAVVGMSDNTGKPAGYVPAYLIGAGYDVIAVNPTKDDIQGRPTYDSLDDIPADVTVDVVDVFRPAAEIPGIARQALRLKPKTFWMQQGLRSAEARTLLEAEGIAVVEDHCMLAEHKRRHA